jgi:hypothetical protein
MPLNGALIKCVIAALRAMHGDRRGWVLILAPLAAIAAGCSDSHERRVERVETLMKMERFLGSAEQPKAVWIVKHSWVGTLHVGTMFGYVDNLKSCEEFVDAYNKRYPEVHYSCREI